MTGHLPSLSTCDALVAVMVAVSAADTIIPTSELVAIQRCLDHMPVFADYDVDRLRGISQTVLTLFDEEDGIDALFGLVRDALPQHLVPTAYAMACDVAAADGKLSESENAVLTEIRDQLGLDRLSSAAIEYATAMRHRALTA